MVGNLLMVKGTLKTSSLTSWLCGAVGTTLSRGPRDQPVWDDVGEPLSASLQEGTCWKRNSQGQPPAAMLGCGLSPLCSQATLEHFHPTRDSSSEVLSQPCRDLLRAALKSEVFSSPFSFPVVRPASCSEGFPWLLLPSPSIFPQAFSPQISHSSNAIFMSTSWRTQTNTNPKHSFRNSWERSIEKTKLFKYPICLILWNNINTNGGELGIISDKYIDN